jgi:UDP-N-acetylglucosamine 2-epimerase (non-hydrolysing)
VPGRWKIASVVGTRPNFMKAAPIVAELERAPEEFDHALIHTGQHYDAVMSEVFFEELSVGRPDHMLEVGSGTHARQTARVMERLEPVLVELDPDLLLVPGDVNSTVAAALTAAKLGIPVGHIEAGLRSFDRTMPEELNRIVTDQLSDLLFIHSPEALENLVSEGRPADRVHAVGNTMIDTLVALRPRIARAGALERLGLDRGGYLLVTLHRPALVDGPLLVEAIDALAAVAERMPVVFPVHPRTRGAMERLGADARRLTLLDPLGYLEFMQLVTHAAGVLTDSGGIQEETTYLGVPCFTLRDNTERPITCTAGTNTLLGLAPHRIREVPDLISSPRVARHEAPPGWDGHAARRVVDVIASYLAARQPERRAA